MKTSFHNHLAIYQKVINPWLTATVLEYFHESNPTALRPGGIRETMQGACKEAKCTEMEKVIKTKAYVSRPGSVWQLV